MANKDWVRFSSFDCELKSVNYQKIGNQEGNFKIDVSDEIKIIEMTSKGFLMEFSRNVSLIPRALFTIETIFEIMAEFDEKAKKYFGDDLEKIRGFIEKNRNQIVEDSRAVALSALLISQLTVVNRSNPLMVSTKLNLPTEEKS